MSVAEIEPIATAPIARPQITPSTRARTSSGITRWTSVNPATSSTLFAAPTTASNRSAATRYSDGAISMIGAPQKISDQPNGDASLRPASETAPSAPTSPPAPIAAVR